MDDQRGNREYWDALSYIEVSWPSGDDFDFEGRWRTIFPVLRAHGYDFRAFMCGAFTSFPGTRESADAVRAALSEIDTAFTVAWRPAKK